MGASYQLHDVNYDALGRKTDMDDPDMGRWYYQYNAVGNLVGQIDANRQMQTMSYDKLGRLTGKYVADETTRSLYDPFDTRNETLWAWNTYQFTPYPDGGKNVAQNTGTDSSWDAHFYRTAYSLSDGEGVQVRFKVSSSQTRALFVIETSSPNYYQWGVLAEQGGALRVQYQAGSSASYPANLLPMLEVGDWYVLHIVVDDRGEFVLQVHKEGDPRARGVYRMTPPAGMKGRTWHFHHWTYRDSAYLDDYTEFSAAVYGYDSTAGGNKGIGRRTSMSNANDASGWRYDARGRVTQETKVIAGVGGGTFVTAWAYDAMDRVTEMTYPGGDGGQAGEAVHVAYGEDGAVNSLTGEDGAVNSLTGEAVYVHSTTYDAAGRVALRVLGGNTLRTDYVYYPWTTANGQGRLQQITTGTPSNLDSLQDLRYAYDAVGNVTTYQVGQGEVLETAQTLTYDALDRLLTVSGGQTATYAYNTIGNLNPTARTYGAAVSGCTSGTPASKPHAVTTAGNNSYSYDCNGNMITRNMNGTIYSLSYDTENRLTGISGSDSASFYYDGDGQRVKAVVGSATTVYIGNHFEWSGSISTMKKYYTAGGQRVAMREGSGTVYYLLTDHLGGTAVTANSSGGMYSQVRYLPYGGIRSQSSTGTPTTFRFTGQRLEATLGGTPHGLYFYNARWYDPTTYVYSGPQPTGANVAWRE